MKFFAIILLLLSLYFPISADCTKNIAFEERNKIYIIDNTIVIYATVQLNKKTISGYFMVDTGYGGAYSITEHKTGDQKYIQSGLSLFTTTFRNLVNEDEIERYYLKEPYKGFFNLAKIDILKIGNTKFENNIANISNLGQSWPRNIQIDGIKINLLGIIGASTLFSDNLCIDLDNGLLYWSKNELAPGNSIKIPVVMDYVPYIIDPMKDNNSFESDYLSFFNRNFVIDTGYDGGIALYPCTQETLDLFPDSTKTICSNDTEGLTTVSSADLFGIKHTNISASCNYLPFLPYCAIGMEVLANYNMYFDIRGSKKYLYLSPRSTFNKNENTIDLSNSRSAGTINALYGFILDSNNKVTIKMYEYDGDYLLPEIEVGDTFIKVEHIDSGTVRLHFIDTNGIPYIIDKKNN